MLSTSGEILEEAGGTSEDFGLGQLSRDGIQSLSCRIALSVLRAVDGMIGEGALLSRQLMEA
jgi:hypothetical protein